MDPKNLNLLLIEDDENDALIIKYFLAEGDGERLFHIRTAGTMREGCRLIQESEFDAVLLDLTLPDSQGIDSLLKVRVQKPDLPVIVLTGLKDEAVAFDALSLGAQEYLIKGMINGYFLKRSIAHAVERARQATQFEHILAQDPDGKVIVNAAGIICYANPAAESLLGRRAYELLGKPFTYPLPAEGSLQVKTEGPRAEERLIEVRATRINWRRTPGRLASLRDMTPEKRFRNHRVRVHGGSR